MVRKRNGRCTAAILRWIPKYLAQPPHSHRKLNLPGKKPKHNNKLHQSQLKSKKTPGSKPLIPETRKKRRLYPLSPRKAASSSLPATKRGLEQRKRSNSSLRLSRRAQSSSKLEIHGSRLRTLARRDSKQDLLHLDPQLSSPRASNQESWSMHTPTLIRQLPPPSLPEANKPP